MRTTAEARQSPTTRAGAAATTRRPRIAAKAAPRASAEEAPAVAVTTVRMLRVDEGLYALRIGELAGSAREIAGLAVPAAQVSVPFAEDGNGVEIVAAFPRSGPWVEKSGGTLILRAPIGGGYVIVTVYGEPDQPAADLPLELRRLDGAGNLDAAAPALAAEPAAPGHPGSRDVPMEILLHIERAGDRLFPGRGWVGALGRRMRIEAFSIRPLGQLMPAELEMKGYLPNGGETPWMPGGALCGTRGRGLPLTGFAVRIVPQRADRFAVSYQGSFFEGGISSLCQNGEPCRAASGDDPLEAINLRVTERIAEGREGQAAG